jgi:succinate dehydrogenase / fumarate reductase cytochrome b subunit
MNKVQDKSLISESAGILCNRPMPASRGIPRPQLRAVSPPVFPNMPSMRGFATPKAMESLRCGRLSATQKARLGLPMIEKNSRVERPLSPHLQIYRVTITMAMSIVHRITGSALYVGMLLFAWWLFAAANPRHFDTINGFLGSWFGRLILFGFTWALLHHLLGGIRHLIWDTGRGLEPGEREFLAWATLLGSVTLTVVIWILAIMVRS